MTLKDNHDSHYFNQWDFSEFSKDFNFGVFQRSANTLFIFFFEVCRY